jgi:LETM1 and EF-hand domain-containing protein 1
LITKLEFSNPHVRNFSCTSSLLSEKPSSKIEETVNAVKEKAQKEAEGKEIAAIKPTKTIKQKVIDEVMHYYHGFKLLGLNAKISFKLALKKIRGHDLTRREHNLVSLLKMIGILVICDLPHSCCLPYNIYT